MIGLSGLITPSLDEMVARRHARWSAQGFDAAAADRRRDHQRKHTAVKIAPAYHEPIIHVQDASRARRRRRPLIDREQARDFDRENRDAQARAARAAQPQRQQQARLPYRRGARKRVRASTGVPTTSPRPRFLGTRVLDDCRWPSSCRYIDWSPFFMAWELTRQVSRDLRRPDSRRRRPASCSTTRSSCSTRSWTRSCSTAQRRLRLLPGQRDGDDIVLYTDERAHEERLRFHMLRQQWEARGPDELPQPGRLRRARASSRPGATTSGAFAVTAGLGADELAAELRGASTTTTTRSWSRRSPTAWPRRSPRCCTSGPARDWGYGPDEKLTNDDLIDEKYRGIRPAAGYPACPDHTEKGTLWELLDATRDRHPADRELRDDARRVGERPLLRPSRRRATSRSARSTATRSRTTPRRKGMPVPEVERWLAPNLGYDRGNSVRASTR